MVSVDLLDGKSEGKTTYFSNDRRFLLKVLPAGAKLLAKTTGCKS